jgi:hypothetical protein
MNLECDVCHQPVRFWNLERGFEHIRSSTCTGIDGIVLGIVVEESDPPVVADHGDPEPHEGASAPHLM